MNRQQSPTQFRAIKCSLNTIGFRQEYRENLERYVAIVNDTTMHAFSLLKLILLDELSRDEAFDPLEQLTERFFYEVWLSLIRREPATRLSVETAGRRAIIQPYAENYFATADYQPPALIYSQQAGLYVSERMLTAYLNNIRNNFGIQLRRAVNLLLNVKPRIETIRLRAMLEQQRTGNVIDVDARIRERFVPIDPLFRRVLFYLRPFFESYPEDYVFEQNNIYYDCKANPARRFKAYYCLAMVFDQLNARNINCFPQRTTWIPSYVTIDTKIMLQNIIGERWPHRGSAPNRPIWRRAVDDLNRPVFKNQSRGPRLKFHNMIQTDGVGVSVLKSRRRPGQRQVTAPPADQPELNTSTD